jgi:hypothetical protein
VVRFTHVSREDLDKNPEIKDEDDIKLTTAAAIPISNSAESTL